MVTLSIVIVNWNSKEFVRQCLASLRKYASDLNPQVIVVDGASYDGCREMVAADFPEVEFIQCTENVGFGRANNSGFEMATGEALLLLNPDAEVLSGSLQALLAELASRQGAGIIGPRLLNTDQTLQTSVQALPRPFRQAFDSEVLRRVLWPMRLWAPPTDYVPPGPIEVEATSGACMLLWSRVFRAAGGFSPQYFMYAEDMDLCYKVRRMGLRNYHVPTAHVLHHGGGSSSTQGSTYSAVMSHRALYLYLTMNHGRLHAIAFRAATAIAAGLRAPLAIVVLGVSRANTRRAIAKSSLARNLALISWSVWRGA